MLVCYLICQYFDIFFPCKPPVNVSLARLSALITYCQFTSGQINHVQPGSMLSVDCAYAWFMIGFPLEVSSPHKLNTFFCGGGRDINRPKMDIATYRLASKTVKRKNINRHRQEWLVWKGLKKCLFQILRNCYTSCWSYKGQTSVKF